MKKLILLAFLALSSASLFAETNFSAVLIKETNVLSVVIEDHGFVPPLCSYQPTSILLLEPRRSVHQHDKILFAIDLTHGKAVAVRIQNAAADLLTTICQI